MKLLYVGEDRDTARRASEALGGVTRDAQVVWARSFPAALGWLRDNADAAAVIADANLQHESVTGFAARARSAGVAAPLIVVAPPDSDTPDGPYEIVMRTTTFSSDLADAIRRVAGPGAPERRESEPSIAAVRAECDARLALAAAARDDLEEQLREKSAALEEAVSIRSAIEYRLTVLQSARTHAEQQLVIEQAAAAHRQAELESRAVEEAANRKLVEQQLAEAQAALEQAERRRVAEAAHAADVVEGRTLLEQQLAEARSALEEAERRREAESAAAADVADARKQLEQQLAETRSALEEAERRREAASAAGARELTKRRAEFAAAIAELSRSRDAVAQQLSESAAALDALRRTHADESAAAAERLARREEELAARVSHLADAKDLLERRVREADAARVHAEKHASAQQSAATRRITDLEAQFAEASTSRSVLEQKLGEIEGTLEEAEERHRAQMAALAASLAEQRADYDARLTQATDARHSVTRQLRDATAALETARAESAAQARAAAEQLAARESELTEKLTEAAAVRGSLERQLADLEEARQGDKQRAALDRDEAAAHRAQLEARLAREVEAGRSLEQQLAQVRAAAADAERQSADRIAALEAQSRARETELQESAARDRAAHERIVAAKDEELVSASARGDGLQQALNELRGELEAVRREFEDIAKVASDHAAEVARLGAVVTERDAEVRELTSSRLAMQRAHQEALAESEQKLRAAREAGAREASKLQEELASLGRDLELARNERDALRVEADRVPHLNDRLRQQHERMRRQFEHTPYGVMRMGRDGRVTEVNRSLIRLLGYRTADEVRALDFASQVFDSEGDFRLLIDGCLMSGARETAEVTWKRRNGARRIVRLLAFAAAQDAVEMIAEDITDLRTVEEQLRHAQRLEAVARLASEVAVTCGNLLRDVVEEGQRWLEAAALSDGLRPQGERLLHDVTRAASFLRQLSVYGDQQTSALEPVEVNHVLRSFAPVLARVAGDEIQFVLPKPSRPLHVDVDIERLQRILVNVASYARQRMPLGGRLKVELGKVIAEQKLLAKHPNVRPGAHALLTVTEEPAKASAAAGGDGRAATNAAASTSSGDRPGLDLGVLLELVGGCGGHLWMAAEPAGNIVLKIYLPQRVADTLADQTGGASGTATRLVGDLINSFRPLRARS